MPRAEHEPLLPATLTHGGITEWISGLIIERRAPLAWFVAFGVCGALTLVFLGSLSYLFSVGVGIFGLNIPVAWGFPIVNTIWWIGIAHAGTLISAVLLLTRQDWRASINRIAEAMAMFAIVCAGLYPLIHLGRPWFFYYILPYPNTMDLWPQWRSPLVWDFFAITMYLLFTMSFLYLSLLPDLATLRDRARSTSGRVFYGLLAMGWRNSAAHWSRYQRATLILAGCAAPIVALVTGIVSTDLAVSIVPGFHFTIFPPYFVAGALFSGFATVTLLAVVLRWMFSLQAIITPTHLDYLGRMMLAFVMIVDFAYSQEMFTAWYSGEDFYRYVYIDRMTGPYAPMWWSMILCNVVLIQLLWFKRVRRTPAAILGLAIVADIGMWLERFQILFTSTHADYMPSNWNVVWPTFWDWSVYLGSLGLFGTLLLLFLRLMPMVSLHDMRELISRRGEEGGHD
ncbi:NrfD/PsrC family molybdoenzyme membrane anchor subunit [Salinisphaera aquimarina]|uniref:NrfD/PsrC family molybdoenzyme membrane anchor subunit n=1 Tax=Salinisphaera aquimarina TaxID=2094031 RepID=A0ABV7ELR0_9GAMM